MQTQEELERTSAEKRVLDEAMREVNDKRESVAQWEAQISDIISWWVENSLLLESGQI